MGTLPVADAIILAVAHQEFLSLQAHDFFAIAKQGACLIDVKSQLDADVFDSIGFSVWRL